MKPSSICTLLLIVFSVNIGIVCQNQQPLAASSSERATTETSTQLPSITESPINSETQLDTIFSSPVQNEAYQAFVAELEQAARDGVLTLHLNNQLVKRGITELPPEIGQITTLRELYLGDNNLNELPPEIGKLVNLEILYLGCSPFVPIDAEDCNNLTELPSEITQLTNLKVLNLVQNKFSVFPPQIKDLKNLEELHLRYNDIAETPTDINPDLKIY